MGWPLPRPVSNCSSKLCNVLSACWVNCRYRLKPSQLVGKGGGGVGRGGPGACPWGGAAGQNGIRFQNVSGRDVSPPHPGTGTRPPLRSPHPPVPTLPKIGRASCRERV